MGTLPLFSSDTPVRGGKRSLSHSSEQEPSDSACSDEAPAAKRRNLGKVDVSEDELDHFLAFDFVIPGILPPVKAPRAEPGHQHRIAQMDRGGMSPVRGSRGAVDFRPSASEEGGGSSFVSSGAQTQDQVDGGSSDSPVSTQSCRGSPSSQVRPFDPEAIKNRFPQDRNKLSDIFCQFCPRMSQNQLLRPHRAEDDCMALMFVLRSVKEDFEQFLKYRSQSLLLL